MTFEQFIDKAWASYCEARAHHEKWLHDNDRMHIVSGPIGSKVSSAVKPKPNGFAVSNFTLHEIRHSSRGHAAIDFDIDAEWPFMKLFGLPVVVREGLDDFEFVILPEVAE